MSLRGHVVRIDWEDHYSVNNGWQYYSEVNTEPFNEIICSSVGLVIGDQKSKLVLAQTWHPAGKDDHKIADFMVILKGCIRKVTILQKKVMK
jgi:hypothetical protein